MAVTNRDTATLITPGDVAAALGLLSRLPIPVDMDKATTRGAAAAWAYPLAGFVIGAIVAAVASAAVWIGLPVSIAAALALAASVIITGAMHEDGLSDSADGLWGGWDPARRLEIMQDSHIGVYGVAALALSFLIRWLAFSTLIGAGLHWAAIITAAMTSRACMAGLMAVLPNARDGGLSKSVGRPSTVTALIAAAIAVVMTLFFWGWWGVLVLLIAEIGGLCCAAIARAKIGGQTGDILGATQQVTEMLVLLTLVCAVST